MTVQQLLEAALRLAGSKDAAQDLDGQDGLDAFEAANLLYEAWGISRYLVPSVTTESFSLTANQSRTIGSGGDFNTTRPLRIEAAWVRDSANKDRPLKIIKHDEYARLTDKTESAIPSKLFYERSFPTGTIYFDSTPLTGYTLYLHSWRPLSEFSSLDATLSLEPGVREAFKYNLAMNLADEFGLPVTQHVADRAKEMLRNLKSLNISVPMANFDPALTGQVNVYNIESG